MKQNIGTADKVIRLFISCATDIRDTWHGVHGPWCYYGGN